MDASVSTVSPDFDCRLIIHHHVHNVFLYNLIYHLFNYCKVVNGNSTYIDYINGLTKNCCFVEVYKEIKICPALFIRPFRPSDRCQLPSPPICLWTKWSTFATPKTLPAPQTPRMRKDPSLLHHIRRRLFTLATSQEIRQDGDGPYYK